MSESKTVGYRASEDDLERIDQFRRRHDKDTRAAAIEQLVNIGLRESSNPLVYRLKDQVIEWAGHLGLAAMVVVVAGFVSTVFTPVHALQIALVLIAMALGLIAMVEVARLGTGQSELGERLRGAWR